MFLWIKDSLLYYSYVFFSVNFDIFLINCLIFLTHFPANIWCMKVNLNKMANFLICIFYLYCTDSFSLYISESPIFLWSCLQTKKGKKMVKKECIGSIILIITNNSLKTYKVFQESFLKQNCLRLLQNIPIGTSHSYSSL